MNTEKEYIECAKVAGNLQRKVHTLEEEVKQLNMKAKLDDEEKQRNAEILKKALDDVKRENEEKLKAIEKLNNHCLDLENVLLLGGGLDLNGQEMCIACW